MSLDKLLAEEQGHLYSMVRRLEADNSLSLKNVQLLCERERTLYVRLLSAIEFLLDDTLPKVA